MDSEINCFMYPPSLPPSSRYLASLAFHPRKKTFFPEGKIAPLPRVSIQAQQTGFVSESGWGHLRERGRADGHEPPLFPLLCHILAFFSSGSHESALFPLPGHHIGLFLAKLLFLNNIFWAFKMWFTRVTQKINI